MTINSELDENKDMSINLGDIASDIQDELEDKLSNKEKAAISSVGTMVTGVPGFDALMRTGIPQGSNILVSGGPGSGKTIFCLQLLAHHASEGRKCLFISFEESETRLIEHMESFGWDPLRLIDDGFLNIKRYLTSDVYYDENVKSEAVHAMMAKEINQYTMDLEPFVIGDVGFKPEIIVIDSLTSIASTFVGGRQKYRMYLDRLFRFFETIGSTNFLISENMLQQNEMMGNNAEDFLADGVVYFYNSRKHNVRESAVEILKMRGVSHDKKIVAMNITDRGIVVYPDQEAFSRYD